MCSETAFDFGFGFAEAISRFCHVDAKLEQLTCRSPATRSG